MSDNARNCLIRCCILGPDRVPLVGGSSCIVEPGVYENVIVEIDENCQVVRMEPAEKLEVKGCDSCA